MLLKRDRDGSLYMCSAICSSVSASNEERLVVSFPTLVSNLPACAFYEQRVPLVIPYLSKKWVVIIRAMKMCRAVRDEIPKK